jgi:transcriptional regulator with XRE-family HTH domain
MPRERKSRPRDPQLAALGSAIEQRIVEVGMSQSSLAGASGIDLRRINDYVRGQYNPSYRNMRKLFRALKISVDELMDRTPGRRPQEPAPHALKSLAAPRPRAVADARSLACRSRRSLPAPDRLAVGVARAVDRGDRRVV